MIRVDLPNVSVWSEDEEAQLEFATSFARSLSRYWLRDHPQDGEFHIDVDGVIYHVQGKYNQ